MLSNATIDCDHESNCEGKVGRRHSISRRHLKLIADKDGSENHIYAIRERRTFFEHTERDAPLPLVSIKEFSAGKWACQKHDKIFENLDEELVDLSIPENLYKYVGRVVFRHNLLMQQRWIPIWEKAQEEHCWKQLKENLFFRSVSDEVASETLTEWRNTAAAVHSMAANLSRNIRKKCWNSLQIRACMLRSEPVVAGWGCNYLKFPVDQLSDRAPRKEGWGDHIDLGYIIVIPQGYGHAMITACASTEQFRVNEIARIHRIIPFDVNPNKLYSASEGEKKLMSNAIWGCDEIGISASLYEKWNKEEKATINSWLKAEDKMKKSVWIGEPAPFDLPRLF